MKFKIIWKNGLTETLIGNNIIDALDKAGYKEGAVVSISKYSIQDVKV